ncbi:MAG: hypothetical protein RIS88_121, partial [Pseudomonadota bacterium]
VGFAKKFDWERIGMQLSESLLNH